MRKELDSILLMHFELFCIHELNLNNYCIRWFPSVNSSENNNFTIHLDCNDGKLIEKIKTLLPKETFVDFIHKGGLTLIDMRKYEYEEFHFKYHIHIKILN